MRVAIITIWTMFFLGMSLMHTGCGGTQQAGEKELRKSERFYEAASIAWFQENDTLAAIRSLSRAVELNPDNDHARYLLGIIRFSRGEYEEAEIHLVLSV